MIRRMLLILMAFVMFSTLLLVSKSVYTSSSINVIWREDVGQYYTYSRYSILASDLKDRGISPSSYNASELFKGAEVPPNYFGDPKKTVIVIPNPPNEFGSLELSFLKNFVEAGGKLIIMGDVQYDTRQYGKPDYLNALLDYIGIGNKVRFWGTNDDGDEIKDYTQNYGYYWQVVVTSDCFSPHLISYEINKVVITSSSLIVLDPSVLVATSPQTSYAQSASGKIHTYGNVPWLAATELGEGKIVVCGSSVIFSDSYVYGRSVPYIKTEDNEKLFFNIIWWLTEQRITAPYKIEPIGIIDVFPIVAGVISGIILRRNGKVDYRAFSYLSMIASLLFAFIATIQVTLFGQVIVGTAIPGWGDVMKIKGETIPAELNAFIRYFFTGAFWICTGFLLIALLEWLDRYLELGITKRLGIKPEEVMKE
ncbi:MAG: hypothetical protein QW143_04490 [Candidatus Korarchaeota archaeon]